MIKRDGVQLMNARSKNVSVAKETVEILKKKSYTSRNGNIVDISDAMKTAVSGTVLYQQDMMLKKYPGLTPNIEVTEETTAQASARWVAEGKNVAALNFASARNPGGGFLAGAVAQEEDLARCSGLYACVKSKPMFYNDNILCNDTFYTDNIIYSPQVPFFRDEHLLFLEEPFLVSIISAPAPNVRSMENVDEEILYTTLHYRAVKILEVAEFHGHKDIVLGAWGCGAFGNSADMVADCFMEALHLVPAFNNVCFAIYERGDDKPLLEAFKKRCLVQQDS